MTLPPREPAASADPPPAAHRPRTRRRVRPDTGRRQFFRLFGRQAIQTVTQVAGVASAVSQMPTNAAAGLMGLGLGDPRQKPGVLPAGPGAQRAPTSARAAAATTRPTASPYRIEGDVLYLLDQRRLPEVIEEQTCRRGSDVAFYLRAGRRARRTR